MGNCLSLRKALQLARRSSRGSGVKNDGGVRSGNSVPPPFLSAPERHSRAVEVGEIVIIRDCSDSHSDARVDQRIGSTAMVKLAKCFDG